MQALSLLFLSFLFRPFRPRGRMIPMKNTPRFQEWLRVQMQLHRLNQGDFARKMGLSPATVTRWFPSSKSSASAISDDSIKLLCQGLKIRAEDLRRIAEGPEEGPTRVKESGPEWKLPTTSDPVRRLLCEWIAHSAPQRCIEIIHCVYRAHAEEKGGESSDRGQGVGAAGN
jgi:transcriptional regulator with XRE-family HTH domain